MSPQVQMDYIISVLEPLAREGLIIGSHLGNHSDRINKTTSLDFMGLICRQLRVPYLGHSAFHIWKVGKQSYTIHSTHGSSGARLAHSKIRAALDIFRYTEAQVILHGHLHGLDNMTQLYFRVDKKRKTIVEDTRHVVLTGSYLGYTGSYAEKKNLPPVQMGSPLISLYGNEHCIHVSL